MAEGRRKRKSLWDAEEENKGNSWTQKERYSAGDGWRHQNVSPSRVVSNSLKTKDQSGWSSFDPHHVAGKIEDVYKDGQGVLQTKELDRDNSHYKSMSPGLDGWDQRKRNHSPEDTLRQTHRYVERGRSRSRDRGRSRDRSRSRSRDRGRNRGSGWDRSRSRSRSRNRKMARSRSRSRSPFHDRRSESYGWNDRRTGSGVSSRTCRDFAVGKCRKGSQCRFLHPDNINRMDGDCPENELAERLGSGIERGQDMKYSSTEGPGAQSWGRGSDVTYRGHETLGNRNRDRITCKEFMRGKCKWGASCRFSHHVSSGDNGEQGGRNTSFGRDHDHRTGEIGKSVCRYFLAGNCNKANCRFSHDGPTAGNPESRPRDGGEGCSLVGERGQWDGPTWDGVEKVSNINKVTGWGDSQGANRPNADAIQIGMADNTWGHESRTWDSAPSTEKASGNFEYLSPHKWKEDRRGTGPIKSMITEDFDGHESLMPRALESQNMDPMSQYAYKQKIGQGNSDQHFATSKDQELSKGSNIQEHQNVAGDNVVKVFSFGGLDGGKKTSNSVSQNGAGNMSNRSLVSNDSMSYQTSAQNIDLNGPSWVLSSVLSSERPEMQEHATLQSFSNLVPNGQDAQKTYHAESLTQKIVNDQGPSHPRAVFNSQTSTQLINSLQSLVPSLGMTYAQSNSAARANLLGDSTELGNSNQPPGNLPHLFEQKSQLPLEQFSPLSTGNAEIEQTHGSKLQYSEFQKSKQQETTAASEIEVIQRNDDAESKEKQQNIPKKSVNDDGKAEDAAGNKDDKETRLFKNALIEFVKEILKPTWKEGRMSREVHKTVVKKVVDKVTSSIQADHIPKTQDRIEQYLSHCKSKITKLVQAYVERNLKTES